jgi:hypothetical protein
MPLLRQQHAHHLDLPARATAETQTHASSAKDQDRHLMMTELMLDTCKYDHCLCWLPADNVIPCIVTPMLTFGKTQKRKIALQRRSVTHSKLNSRPCRVAKLPTLPPRSATSTPAPAAKSPWLRHHRRSQPAISYLGAFRPPALGVRGETVIPAAENLHNTGSSQPIRSPGRCGR